MIRDGIMGDLMPGICGKRTTEEYSEAGLGIIYSSNLLHKGNINCTQALLVHVYGGIRQDSRLWVWERGQTDYILTTQFGCTYRLITFAESAGNFSKSEP